MTPRPCSFDECDRRHYASGLCQPHYLQRRRGVQLKPLRRHGRTTVERFADMLEAAGDCWRWRGAKAGGGYGTFRVDGRVMPAHRWSYDYMRAPVPEGLDLDHLCHNRWCVNPWHLEPVTRAINTQRGLEWARTHPQEA